MSDAEWVERQIVNSVDMGQRQIVDAIQEAYCSPCVVYKPRLFIDGDQWCALYGVNIQDGVAGFGTSPDKALRDFNTNWYSDLPRGK